MKNVNYFSGAEQLIAMLPLYSPADYYSKKYNSGSPSVVASGDVTPGNISLSDYNVNVYEFCKLSGRKNYHFNGSFKLDPKRNNYFVSVFKIPGSLIKLLVLILFCLSTLPNQG